MIMNNKIKFKIFQTTEIINIFFERIFQVNTA